MAFNRITCQLKAKLYPCCHLPLLRCRGYWLLVAAAERRAALGPGTRWSPLCVFVVEQQAAGAEISFHPFFGDANKWLVQPGIPSSHGDGFHQQSDARGVSQTDLPGNESFPSCLWSRFIIWAFLPKKKHRGVNTGLLLLQESSGGKRHPQGFLQDIRMGKASLIS